MTAKQAPGFFEPVNYDITDATQSALQEPKRHIDWALICGLPHEWTDPYTGLGTVLYEYDSGVAMRACENCEAIRADYDAWAKR